MHIDAPDHAELSALPHVHAYTLSCVLIGLPQSLYFALWLCRIAGTRPESASVHGLPGRQRKADLTCMPRLFRRLYETCGDIPLAELEDAYYRQINSLTEATLSETRVSGLAGAVQTA